MRPLPPEVVHDPVEGGPYRMAMGLMSIAEPDWFEIDARYPAEMAEKCRLLGECSDDVVAAVPGAEDACAEASAMVAAHLCTHRPDWFSRDDRVLLNRLTGETLDLDAGDPLVVAARLVQEDLCLILNRPQGAMFVAGVVCFPSRWRLSDKIGQPLADVHGPVPLYASRLAGPVDRFMRHLRPGRIAGRLNWSVVDDPALYQPAGKWRSDRNVSVTAQNAGDTLFFRVERQTLRLLPRSGAVLFGIRVHVYPLHRIASPRLAAAVRALPEAIARYKSLPSIQTALLAWLDDTQGPLG